MGIGQSTADTPPIEDLPACQTCDDAEVCYSPNLLGTVKLYTRHVLLCTGGEDWPAKIQKEAGSLAAQVHDAIKAGGEKAENILFTACSEKPHGAGIDIIVYPPGIRYVGLTGEQLVEFVKTQLCEGKVAENLKTEPLPWKRLVLVCTHGQRDKRCGRIGPQVVKKLHALLAEKKVPESDVAVRCSSHIGGHKFAGTLIVYPEGQWYGQMSERNAENLVDAYLSENPLALMAKNWRGKMGMGKEETKALLKPAATPAPSGPPTNAPLALVGGGGGGAPTPAAVQPPA